MSFEDLTWNKVKGRKKIEGIEKRAIASLKDNLKPINVRGLILYPQDILIHSYSLYHQEFLIDVLPIAMRKTVELLPDILTEQRRYDYENLGLKISTGITNEIHNYPLEKIYLGDGGTFEGERISSYKNYRVPDLLAKLANPKCRLIGDVELVLYSTNRLFRFEYGNKKVNPKIQCDDLLMQHLNYHYVDVGMSDTEGHPQNRD